jgi:hypothetical protein
MAQAGLFMGVDDLNGTTFEGSISREVSVRDTDNLDPGQRSGNGRRPIPFFQAEHWKVSLRTRTRETINISGSIVPHQRRPGAGGWGK